VLKIKKIYLNFKNYFKIKVEIPKRYLFRASGKMEYEKR